MLGVENQQGKKKSIRVRNKQFQVIKHELAQRLSLRINFCRKGYFSWFIRDLQETCSLPLEKWSLLMALHCFASTFTILVCVFKGGKAHSEVEQLLTRLIMGTNLPVVTLFNDMLLGSAPCWGCDSSPAGPAWWITVGGWWCNHSLAATDTCTSLTPVPSGCISQPAQPSGRHDCSTKRRTKVLYLPRNFPSRTPPSLLGFLFQLHSAILSLLLLV